MGLLLFTCVIFLCWRLVSFVEHHHIVYTAILAEALDLHYAPASSLRAPPQIHTPNLCPTEIAELHHWQEQYHRLETMVWAQHIALADDTTS